MISHLSGRANNIMPAYIELLRPLNCSMTVFGVLAGVLLVSIKFPGSFSPLVILAALCAFIIAGAGNAINDYTDAEIDRANRPSRPIPSGRVSKNSALIFSISLFALGTGLSYFINLAAFAIAAFNSLLLILYSARLQKRVLVGNISISYLVGSSFVFGGAALGDIILPSLLGLLAFLANLSREIVKDLEDLEGDRTVGKAKGKNLAMRYGQKSAKASASIVLALAIIISPLPYILGILSAGYLIALIPCIAVFGYSMLSAWKAKGSKGYGRISRMIKLGMFLGLFAFIAGTLF